MVVNDEQKIAGDLVFSGSVLDEWIDINAHMNVAYYVLAFDLGIDALWNRLGITEDYVRLKRGSTFAVESHIEYIRELRKQAPIRITTQILAYDEKRIHQFLRMYHGDGYLAATSEWMNLHVDLDARRVAPWPADVLKNIGDFASQQRTQTLPERAGRRINIKRPVFSVYAGEGTSQA